jgi:hypothetical protein
MGLKTRELIHAQRLAAWQSRMSDAALWPDFDPARYEAAIVRVADATRRILAGELVAWDAVEEDGARHLGRAAFRLGVGPLIGWWIETGRLRTTPAAAALFAEHLAHSRRRRERLQHEAVRVIGALRTAGVEPILLKGFDSASLYEHPAARAFQDIDLLVAPADAALAGAVLDDLGLELMSAVPQRRTYAPVGPRGVASLELTHADTYWSLDLHSTLARTFARAIEAPVPTVEVASCGDLALPGDRVRVLPPAARLVFVAVHASESLRIVQLSHLLDVIHAARAFRQDGGDWSALAASLRGWRGERFVLPAFVLAERFVPGTFDPAFLGALRQHVHRRLLRAAERWQPVEAARSHERRIEDALMWAETPAEIARVLWRQIAPGPGAPWRQRVDFYLRRLRWLARGDIRFTRPDAPA